MRTPKLRHNKTTDRYVVTISGHDYYLGKDPTVARQAYHRLLLEASMNGGAVPAPTPQDGFRIVEIFAKYNSEMEVYFATCPDTWKWNRLPLAVLVRIYGFLPAAQFGTKELRAFREYITVNGMGKESSKKGLCRVGVNRAVAEVTRMFRWAGSMDLCPSEVYAKCITLEPLKRGRSTAREMEPVAPVALDAVEKTKRHVPATVAALIDLQLLTGARPGELLELKSEDIDRTGPVWVVTLARHKNAHRGKARVLYFGPRAQTILAPHILKRLPGECLFRPMDAHQKPGKGRRPNQLPTARATDRRVRDHYDNDSYRRAITRGCVKAGVPHWHPHQLRHTAGTELRRQFGAEVTRAILGHAHLNTTEIYAEVDAKVAADIMGKIG